MDIVELMALVGLNADRLRIGGRCGIHVHSQSLCPHIQLMDMVETMALSAHKIDGHCRTQGTSRPLCPMTKSMDFVEHIALLGFIVARLQNRWTFSNSWSFLVSLQNWWILQNSKPNAAYLCAQKVDGHRRTHGHSRPLYPLTQSMDIGVLVAPLGLFARLHNWWTL